MKIRSANISGVKAGPGDGLEEGEFLAYASVFGNVDSYGDVVVRGAFADTIKAWKGSGNVCPILFGHNMADPFYNIGGAVELAEDEHGLLVRGRLDLENPHAVQVYRLIKGKRVNQMSFAFDVVDSAQVTLDGDKVNELRGLKLYEVSIVPLGANDQTEILAVKALADLVAAADAARVKEGRVLAQKHIDSLRSAREALDVVIAAAEGDTGKATGSGPAKDEGPVGVKSAGPGSNPSAGYVLESFDLELSGLS